MLKSFILSLRSADNEQTNEVWICRHGIKQVSLATVAVLPLKYAAAQNATMSLPGGMMTKDMIKAKIDQMRSEQPELAPVLDKVQSLDVPQTLKTLIGALELQDVLIAHGKSLFYKK